MSKHTPGPCDLANKQLTALRWQIENEGCAASHLGETTYECRADAPCGLCRLRSERDAAREEVERLRKDHERSIDWYQQRFNRLRRWVKEEVEPLSEDVARRYFAICANGSPSPHESADWRETMHGLSLERDSLRAEKERLRGTLDAVMDACDPECYGCGAYYVAKEALDATKEKP